jgi:hypothetical protein
VREFDGALGIEDRADFWLDRGVCHALRGRVLDAAGRHGDARLAIRAAEDDYARAAALAPEDAALRVARGILGLRAAAIAALEGRPNDARALAEAAARDLDEAADSLPPESPPWRHVDSLRPKR